MFLFIFSCLSLGILVHMNSPWLTSLASPLCFYAGLVLALLCGLLALFKKSAPQWSYDLFLTGSLLAWFARWRPLFYDDSPIFFFFPLYLVLVAAFLELALLSQRAQADQASLNSLQAFADGSKMQPWLLMAIVLASLGLEQHYLLYPVAVTVLLLRIAMRRYLLAAKPPLA